MQLKPYTSIIVVLFFAISSAIASIGSYDDARNEALKDLSQALSVTLEEQKSDVITADTIKIFNSHLQISELKEQSFIACSPQGELRAYCSPLTIWRISDQRLSAIFGGLAIFWAISSVFYYRRRTKIEVGKADFFGGIRYDSASNSFYNSCGNLVHLTPMQHHLMTMFYNSATHSLTHREICAALWPKKDDASETLYALISRLKPTLERNSSLQIEVRRGQSYTLKDKTLA